MSIENNGGSAFPGIMGPPSEFESGMSLRDYFASSALPVLLHFDGDRLPFDDVAEMAYGVADAMLVARRNGQMATEYEKGVRDGINQAMQIAIEQAGLMADLAIEGLPEASRNRGAMEAALTRFSQTLRVTLEDLCAAEK